jgi:Na+/melibiose symporter-like transporter
MISTTQHPILWLKVWGLAAVQGAITLMWVIYNLYLKQLLTQFGFPETIVTGVLIIENLLAAVVEPAVGSSSDRFQRTVGSRFPFIAFGAVWASALFIAIPAIVILGGNWQVTLHWILPVAVITWALAMTFVRSPALSLLGRYAFATKLPQAASILTLVGAVTGAMAPLANQFILQLGSAVTFTIGSLVLLGATAVLRFVDPPTATAPLAEDASFKWNALLSRLALVMGAGVGIAIGFRSMMQTFPQILKAQVPAANANLVLACIFIGIALTAIPSGTLATRIGNTKAMLLGLGTIALLLVLLLFVKQAWVAGLLAFTLGAAFSLVSNGTIPFALSMVPSTKAGLGTGIFFGGGAVGLSIFFSAFSQLSPAIGTIVGAAAFLFAGGCILLARANSSQD